MTDRLASSPRLLTLHALRLKGFGDGGVVAERFALDAAEVSELLLDSCHACRMEFPEDLVATLGISRGDALPGR